ncbi:ABC transporter permease [Paenibacillus eucommiae]|uniref:Aldouronate transport system permease protein n=1 Tax=Paenibacillus eucommiae TaxID=1355755 RepID=A0ABS4J0Y0_9BACL|nr:ABC transporter permease subunit [Paenibacillus eucommiae]MBP1992429.1 putative aldouronate transport system permease protein [Paenibacillus eucommiae]
MNKIYTKQYPLHVMLIPGVIFALVFSYAPMVGIVIAFQRFFPVNGLFGSSWIGLDNFKFAFSLPDFSIVLSNTLSIASMKILAGLIVPIFVALLLNEVRIHFLKRSYQTLIYLPHFLSWVILGGILTDILSLDGIINQLLHSVGVDRISFLSRNAWFPTVLIVSDVWKEFGFNTIVYLAAITSVNPSLYEAAVIDGAGRRRQMWHITLPGMRTIIVLLATLSLGNVLNAGFDQVFNLYNPAVYTSGDILDTFVYRMGMIDFQYGLATAIGMFKSVIAMLLISISYWTAYKFMNYRIF